MDSFSRSQNAGFLHFDFGDDSRGPLPDILNVEVVPEVVLLLDFDELVSLDDHGFEFAPPLVILIDPPQNR